MSQSFTDWSRIVMRGSLILASVWIIAVLCLGGLAYWAWEKDKQSPIAAERSPALLLTIPAAPPAPENEPRNEPHTEPQTEPPA